MKKLLLCVRWAGSALAISVLGSLFVSLFVGGSFGWKENVLQTAAIYNIFCGCLVIGVIGINLHELYFPVMLSCSCSRRKAFLQIQLIKFLEAFGIAAASLLFMTAGSFLGGERLTVKTGLEMGAAAVLVLLLIGSVGNLLGALYSRIGKGVIFVISLIFGVLGAVLGASVAMGINEGIQEVLRLLQNGFGRNFFFIGTAASLAILLADLAGSWMLIRKLAVKG